MKKVYPADKKGGHNNKGRVRQILVANTRTTGYDVIARRPHPRGVKRHRFLEKRNKHGFQ